MKKNYLLLVLICLNFQVFSQTTFNYTGSTQTYTVPAGVTSIGVDLKGGCGGSAYVCCGGTNPVTLGGRVQCTMNVTPGSTLYVNVAGAGSNWTSSTAPGGWNGGGTGGLAGDGFAAGGGGASDIRSASSGAYAAIVLVVAGGGGGGGDFSDAGGAGGGTTGASGTLGACGGGQTGPSCTTGYVLGSQGQGGTPNQYSCGGGGGGWWGGNAGVYVYGGGGGGSSYPATPNSVVTAITHTQGYSGANGNGQVIITVLCEAPGAITGTTTVCTGATTTLSNPSSGGGGTWYSTNTAVATVNPSTGVVTGVAAGTVTIIDSVSSPCGGLSATASVTVNTSPSAITGTLSSCPSGTSTLSSSPTGGTWSSSNLSVATIGTSGNLTAASSGSGTSTISYSLGNGCASATAVFTLNPNPANITGTTTVCGGSVPTSSTLGETTTGGTWSSSNTGLATITSGGVVTGVAAGSSTISYVLPTGCFITTPVNVNAVGNITGSSGICLGLSETLTDVTTGGVWSSTSGFVASIGSSSGVVTTASIGSTNISYTVSSISCAAVMTLNVTTASPTVFSVTGGGSYCSGGAGVHIGTSGSNSGVSYSLFNSGVLVAAVTGSGGTVDFGLITASGAYTVVANYGTACAATMSGSATVTINPLPAIYSVSAGGAYCSGGAGVHVTLNTSAIGINYQLKLGATPVGSPIAGTGGTLDFGPQTAAGAYTVVATNPTTGCSVNMSGSATITINALPASFTVTGGGGYCTGGTGVHVGLSGSVSGTNYQLLIGGSPVGAFMNGTGLSLDFGLKTVAGTYTVLATSTTTGCTNTMSGSAVVTINPLPTIFTITGGGAYCIGGTGVAVGLNNSTSGVNYQLFNGTTAVGTPVGGSGSAISFGLQTGAGSYTVVATNATTGCVNNMAGSVSVTINPLPTSFTVTGGGSYCAGGAGLNVGLSGSVIGTGYYLYNGSTLVGAAPGSGGPLNFGLQLTAGVYTVNATNTGTGCSGGMSGSVTITINPIPGAFTVTGGGSYCAGGTGVAIGLNSSASGVKYQLYNGTVAVGSEVSGTGSAISFGSQTVAGSYTAVAINATTACTNNMLGSALVTINPLPTVYAVTGGGGYCTGGTGVHVGLASSNSGITYQLKNTSGPVGSGVPGTGTAIDFGLITTASTYSVTAANTSTSCSTGMSGSVIVSVNALPTAYAVTGGGNYCLGGAGVHVGLGNSAVGVNYQLFNGITPIGGPVPGSGLAIDFGFQTSAGTYTVVAVNAATACSNNMTGSVTVGINPLPSVFVVTGGGNYCTGGTGVHVGLSGSVSGINYQLMNGGIPVSLLPGTGVALDFGLQTAVGPYTVVATNPVTTCTNNMSGSVMVSTLPLPGLNTVTGGGSYCAGGTGVHVGLNGSITGINYQLLNSGTPVGVPLPGTTLPIDFGLHTAGTYTIVGTNAATGCQATMTGSAIVLANPLPTLHSVMGGGSFCAGGSGVTVGLDGSNTGTNYQLFNGATPVGAAMPGTTGFPIDFGLQTAAGTYVVIATNTATTCSTVMTGSATVGVDPLPIVYNIVGGGNYCSGGAGLHVGLSGSNSGILYQLWNGGSPVGPSIPGTGVAIDFGLQTTAGTYTVKANNPATNCGNNMSGSATIVVNPLPAQYVITGGGDYCTGGTGVHIGLSNSDLGTNYQLYNGGLTVGSPVPGTGLALDFGLQTAAGSYTIVGTTSGTACGNTMAGSVNVNVDPLPTQYTLIGGGNYCSGGTGLDILLSSSDPGVLYQLYLGTALVGVAMPGTGLALDFGMQTSAGTYTVVGTNTLTTCTNNMSNSVTIAVNPLPVAFTVGGGGNYCLGGTGVDVTLSGSTVGIFYQLWTGGSPTGPAMAGTGVAIDFGPQTVSGVYTVKATNSVSTCTNVMTGSASVGINPLPAVFTVNSSASGYCAGGAGVDVSLSGSNSGTSYQLYNGLTAMGTAVAGSGTVIDFGNQFAGGAYSVIATNGAGCSRNMSSSVNITINPLPNSYTVTGGGSFCTGGSGVHVGLSGSDLNVSYQLFRNGTGLGSMTGTSGALDFGVQTVAGNYTVVATNSITSCVNNMSGTATVVVNVPPAIQTVTGGGNYCAGGAGEHVNLNGSVVGVNYQLYKNGTIAIGGPMPGTGSPIDFGVQTAAGIYTAVAINAMSGCTSNMGGSAVIGINPAPAAYPVIGGGGLCPGGTGVHVGISGSTSGISYQLYNGIAMVGLPMTGAGSAIDFGLQTVAGTYSVIATNTVTNCSSTMSGTANVVVNTLPAVYPVVGGGSYCAGGTGVHVGIGNSITGINYILIRGFTTVTTTTGVGGPLDFGLQTTAGTYKVQAVNATTGCSANMSDSAIVSITPGVSPFVSISTSTSDTICQGTFTTFTAVTTNGGTAPTYNWNVNGVTSGSGGVYGYAPSNGDVINVTLTSNATCASPTSVDASITMTVNPHESPAVSVTANPGTVVCQGTAVTYTANPSYGGSTPLYSWVKNSIVVGSSSTYNYIPANGDVLSCTLTSNYTCRLANTATSSNLIMEVDIPATPVVTIIAHPGLNIAAGETVSLTATATNAGPSPTYQWTLNGSDIPGATNSTYVTSNLFDGDAVGCQVTSSGGCAGTVGTGSVSIHVIGVSVKQITSAGSDIKLVPNPNKGIFTIKGTLGTLTDQEVSVEVTDMLGQIIYKTKATAINGQINERIDMGGTVANGMYILNLRSGTENTVFHLVIEQ